MADKVSLPVGLSIAADIEFRPGTTAGGDGYRARIRWRDPETRRRLSKSDTFKTEPEAEAWLNEFRTLAQNGVDPGTAAKTLTEYGTVVMELALRGLEAKTTDPYLAGWRKRVKPTLGHIPVRMITNGAVDRAVHGWIADGCGKSTVKNSIAVLVRVMEQALRDGLIDRNPARNTDARLFTGPRGERIPTAVLRDATHWDDVVSKLGYEHLRRHDLRHTGLTWMADAGAPVHHLRKIAGHGSLTTTQRYLHPNRHAVTDAGDLLSNYLRGSQMGPKLRAV